MFLLTLWILIQTLPRLQLDIGCPAIRHEVSHSACKVQSKGHAVELENSSLTTICSARKVQSEEHLVEFKSSPSTASCSAREVQSEGQPAELKSFPSTMIQPSNQLA
jgi:hypothetical protein